MVGPIITYIDETYGRKWGIRCDSVAPFCVSLAHVVQSTAGLSWRDRSSAALLECPAVTAIHVSPSGQSGFRAKAKAVFVTGRAIIGLGLASFLMTSLIVVQEIPHPRSRATVAASWVCFLIMVLLT